MSKLGAELKDPWGPLLGILAGGLAGVGLGLAAPIAVGIGAAVYGVKVAVGAFTGGDAVPELPAPQRPRYGTPAFTWLKRAEAASRALDDMGRKAGASPTDDSVRRTAEEARGILDDMRRLGGQSAAIMQAMSRVDSPGLDAEADQLRRTAAAYPDDVSAQQSAKAVQDRLAVRDRLVQAGQALDGRLQASALGLEGLLARVAELSATAHAVGEIDPTPDDLAAVTTELDGLRLGLADVEQVARRALGAAG